MYEKLCLIFLGHLGPQVNYCNWSSSVVLGCASSFVRYQIYSFNFSKKTAWLMATIFLVRSISMVKLLNSWLYHLGCHRRSQICPKTLPNFLLYSHTYEENFECMVMMSLNPFTLPKLWNSRTLGHGFRL